MRYITVNLSQGRDIKSATKHPSWSGIVSKVREAELELQGPMAAQSTDREENRHRLLQQGYTEREVDQILTLSRRT